MLNKKGFTLMEVMTAIAIIAIVSGPLLQMFITSGRVGRRSYDTDQANAVTVKTVEAIKADPGSINEATYSHTVTYDGGSGITTHNFTRTDYYAVDWQKLFSGVDCAFRAETTIAGTKDSDSGSLSYIPELLCKSGSNPGKTYKLDVDYHALSAGTYTLTVSASGTNYIVETGSAILTNTLTGIKSNRVEIPTEDCVSPILPVVVDIGADTTKFIEFRVDNTTGIELAIYVYGDYSNDPHCITTSPISGTISINYMKVTNTLPDFDELDVNVKVIRQSDGSSITDYQTMVYLAG